jgi:hypothetical protein
MRLLGRNWSICPSIVDYIPKKIEANSLKLNTENPEKQGIG